MRGTSKAPFAGSTQRPRSSKLLVLPATAIFAALLFSVSLANATAPTVAIEGASEVTYNSAKASGHVDPADKDSFWHFEYATEAQFTNSEWAEASWANFDFMAAESGNTEVSVQLSLSPGTTYHLRLVAENEDGTDEDVAASTFETEAVNPPEAEINSATSVDADSAHLSGTVNSGGSGAGEKAGSYSFSCSPGCPSAEGPHNFQAEGFADGADHAVQAEAEGLLPNTEYTVTLNASNAAGEQSDQTTFTTDAIGPEAITAFVAPRIPTALA